MEGRHLGNKERQSNIIIYKSNDGKINIDVTFENDTVWLTQTQISELYDRSVSTISEHISNIFSEGELIETQVSTKFGNSEIPIKPTTYYNLDVILAVRISCKVINGYSI